MERYLKRNNPVVVSILLCLATLLSGLGCTSQITGPGGRGTTVINSNSLIIGEIKAVKHESSGYPWAIDVLVLSSANVDDLPNPTAGKIGQVIDARTDEDLSSFAIGEKILANVKYVGDVPKPGIILYIYGISSIK